MICIYEFNAEEFDNNGIGTLTPSACTVREEAGGALELTLTHPMDRRGKYTYIQKGRVLRTPVPARLTPQYTIEGTPERVVYTITAAAALYSKPSTVTRVWHEGEGGYTSEGYWTYTGNRRLAALKAGEELTLVKAYSETFYLAANAAGTTGYAQVSKIAYARTIAAVPDETVQSRQIRDQLFRIYRFTQDTEALTVTAYARHIYYDLLANPLVTCNIADKTVQEALDAVSAACLQEHPFTFITDDTATKITQDYSLKSAAEAHLDPETGILPKAKLKLLRDNFDVYFMKTAGVTRTIPLKYGSNLMGVTVDVNEDSMCNRIVPVGQTAKGETLLIDSPYYIDSPNNYLDTVIRAKVIQYEVKVGGKDENGAAYTTATAKARLAALANADFAAGIDGAELAMTVNFLQLGDTVQYRQYRELDRMYIYDTIPIIDTLHGVAVTAGVTEYEFDCLTGRYNSMKFGVTGGAASVGSISGFEIAAASVSGSRLINGSIGAAQIGNGAINSLKIGAAAIGTAHIQEAAIASAHIQDATIDTAKIKDAAIETAKIKDAAIDTAKIKDASITNAKISSAGIDYANIVDLAAGTAVFSTGISDELYINRLYVSAANMAHLEVGDLLFKDANGAFWRLGVDGEGNVTTTPVSIEYQNISSEALLNVSEYVVVRSATVPASPYVGQLWMNTDTSIIKRCTAITPSVVWTPVAANELHTSYISAVETGLEILSSGMIDIKAGGTIQLRTGANLLVDAGRVEFKTDDFGVLDSTGERQVMFLGKTDADQTVANFNVDELAARHILSDVPNSFAGGTVPWKGSIQASLDAIGKFLLADSTLTVPAGKYAGNVIIRGFKGAQLRINFASGTTINGYILVYYNDHVQLYAANVDTVYINPTVAGNYGIHVLDTQYFYFYRLNVSGFMPSSGTRASGNGTLYGMNINGASSGQVINCCIDTTVSYTLYAGGSSQVYIENCFGGVVGGSDPATVANLGYGIRPANGSAVYAVGTTFASVSGDVSYRAPAIGGGTLTVTGSTGTTPAAPLALDYEVNDYKYTSCADTVSNPFTQPMSTWSASPPKSGKWYAQDKQYCGMWRCKLSGGSAQSMITGMSGKTVHSVLLTVHCDTCFGGATAKSLYYLSQNGLPVGGGYPNAFLTDTGVDFPVTEGQDTVIDITDWFKARVAAGTAFYGFGVDFVGSYVSFSTLCAMEILYNN